MESGELTSQKIRKWQIVDQLPVKPASWGKVASWEQSGELAKWHEKGDGELWSSGGQGDGES